MRKPLVTSKFCEFLSNLKVEKIFMQIWNKVCNLLIDPSLSDSRKIGEYNNLNVYRNDIGEYRIIYQYDENYVYFILIGKRNDGDIYKEYKRKMK